MSVSSIEKLNNIKAEDLKEGQILKIPTASGSNPEEIVIYTVKKGDSLYSIANKYGVSVDSIKDLNNLKSINLSIGQTLKIPESYKKEEDMTMPSYVSYTVKKGDSLYSIAKKYDTTIEEIKKDNNLSSNELSIGKVLKIKTTSDKILECYGEDYNPSTTNNITYTVKKGDNLYSLASKYNTSISTIVNLNNLKNTNLSIGQILKIPSTSSTKTYIVKKGDSLYSIAKKYNVSVDTIKKKNNLSSNLINVGDKLLI